jgi:hypothetical protein
MMTEAMDVESANRIEEAVSVPRKRTIQFGSVGCLQHRAARRPGLVLDEKYRLDRLVRSEGGSALWVASHRTIERPFALELFELPAGEEGAELATSFLHAARRAASVHHDNVVEVVDFGLHREGARAAAYVVTELFEGESLDARLERGRVSLRDVVRIGRQVLRGLAAVHDAGIVHGAIVPANVLLVEEGDFSRALLGDLAIASPGEGVDRASDLRAVGALLYEMLSGHPPCGQPLIELSPDVPELCAVVDRALAERPNEAFASAREMHDTLRVAATHAAIGSALSGRHARPARGGAASNDDAKPVVPWSRRAMLRPVAAGAMVLLGVCGGVYFVMPHGEASGDTVGHTLSVPIRPAPPPEVAAIATPAPIAVPAPLEVAPAVQNAAPLPRATRTARRPHDARRTPPARGITHNLDF